MMSINWEHSIIDTADGEVVIRSAGGQVQRFVTSSYKVKANPDPLAGLPEQLVKMGNPADPFTEMHAQFENDEDDVERTMITVTVYGWVDYSPDE